MQFDHIKFGDYEYREYPKYVKCGKTGADRVVHSRSEEEAITASPNPEATINEEVDLTKVETVEVEVEHADQTLKGDEGDGDDDDDGEDDSTGLKEDEEPKETKPVDPPKSSVEKADKGDAAEAKRQRAKERRERLKREAEEAAAKKKKK